MRKTLARTALLAAFCLLCLPPRPTPVLAQSPHGWPIEPMGSEHTIGNSFGDFQDFGGVYQHTGIDILETPKFRADGTEDTSAPWVRATVSGTVSFLSDNASTTQNGTTIQGTDGVTYRYWHMAHGSYHADYVTHYNNGTAVDAGDEVAKLYHWSCNFHHLHYDLISGTNYLSPLADITPNPDPDLPTISAIGFAQDNSDPWVQFSPVSSGGCTVVSGATDIIAQTRDRDDAGSTLNGAATQWVHNARWRACPDSAPACAWQTTHIFDAMPTSWGTSGNAASAAQFSNRAPWDSNSNYCAATWLYGIVTNFSGGTPDTTGNWSTASVSDGSYSVSVEATDFAGNARVYNTRACVQNGTGCTTELAIRDATDDGGAIPYAGNNWWLSPDITANPGTLDEDHNINVGVANPIEVQVWNYGSCNLAAGTTYTVCLGWGLPSSTVPYPLPPGQVIDCQTDTVPAGGWAVGTDRVTTITWIPTSGSVPLGHHCLVAWVDTAQDGVLNTPAVNWDDNRAQQNITFQAAPAPTAAGETSFWVSPQKMIERRSLVLEFKYGGGWSAFARVRLHIAPGLEFERVVGGDVSKDPVSGGIVIEGIDALGQLRLEGIHVQEPVQLTVEVWTEEEIKEGQFADIQVTEYGLLPTHEEIVPVGGVTLRFAPRRADVRVTLGGKQFAHSGVQKAILHAVPWSDLIESIFPGKEIPIPVDVWEVGPVLDDARGVLYDPDLMWELLAEAGFPDGFALRLLFASDDRPITEMVESMAKVQSEAGLEVELMPVTETEAPEVMVELVAAGEPVLWVRR
jgi:hypothetical protein